MSQKGGQNEEEKEDRSGGEQQAEEEPDLIKHLQTEEAELSFQQQEPSQLGLAVP